MKKLMTLCIVLTAVAVIAAPALAEVQNVKVSGDITSAGVYRNSYDLFPASRNATGSDTNETGQDNSNDNFLYTIARVRVDADLTDNVMATIRYLTEWDWDTEQATSSDGDNVDIDLANVTLKEAFYAPLTVIVGRQELRYGNAFVIGDPDTNAKSFDGNLTAGDLSKRKSFDAIRAILDYNPYTVDIFFAKMDETNKTEASDEDLYGINVALDLSDRNAEVEGYWINSKDADGDPQTVGTSGDTYSPGHDIHTVGIRGSVEPVENLSLLGEFAIQRGDFDDSSDLPTTAGLNKRDQEAVAYQIAGDYTISDWDWEPALRAGWTHYSGANYTNDSTPAGDQEAWIPMYEDQTHGVVANRILSGINGGQNSNADILNIGATASPIEDLTVSIDFYNFWLDEKLVDATNTAANNNQELGWTNLAEGSYYLNADDDLGYEIDVALNYDYTEDVQMGLSAGWFRPGAALEGTSSNDRNDETALQVLATLDVAF